MRKRTCVLAFVLVTAALAGCAAKPKDNCVDKTGDDICVDNGTPAERNTN